MAQSKTTRFAAMSRRAAITGAALATMALMAGCGGKGGAAAEGDMALGAPEGAKVTVIEYASVTCGHCAQWQAQVWPQFKARYIDTNKVRYVFREFPTPPAEVAAAGFLVARCAGEDKYFDVVHELLASQQDMQTLGPRQVLLRVATSAGLSEEQFTACVNDQAALDAFDKRVQAAQAAGVNGTPTFMVNGVRVVDSSLEGLATAIDAELAKN
jgi:Protein-disulfide isomerase